MTKLTKIYIKSQLDGQRVLNWIKNKKREDILETFGITPGNNGPKDWLSFADARVKVIECEVLSEMDYKSKRHSNILSADLFPSAPNITYKKSWISWEHFCGRNKHDYNYISFDVARLIMKKLGIKNLAEYKMKRDLGLLPDNMPKSPSQYYKSRGCWDVHVFFNKKKKYLSFTDALKKMKNLNIKSVRDFNEQHNRGTITDIPKAPAHLYKEEWMGWVYFFGGVQRKKEIEYMSFQEAKSLVMKLGIKSRIDFVNKRKVGIIPPNIPSDPQRVYTEWISWDYFLRDENKEWLSFDDAKAFVHSLKIKSMKDFFLKKDKKIVPINIPTRPDIIYKAEWKGWYVFLGKELISFDDARSLMLKLNITTREQFMTNKKNGVFDKIYLPYPPKAYKKYWVSWPHFFNKL